MTRRAILLAGGAVMAVAVGVASFAIVRGPDDGSARARWQGRAAGAPTGSAGAPVGTSGGSSTGPAAGTASADPSVSCDPWGCPQQRRFAAATSLISTRPGLLGVVVRDRRTGAVWQAGSSGHVMWASSTIKLALATSLLERARTGEITLDAAAHRQIAAMFAVSDDRAADALWDRYGRDAQVPRFQQVYGMTGLTFVPGFPRRWGFIKASAQDLQRLISYVLDRLDAADRAYVVGAMRDVGAIQRWGVWAAGAALRPGTKDGWSIESDTGGDHWCTSTVGFAGPDERYAVAVMYHLPPGDGIGAGVRAVSDVVATIFGAATPAQVTVPDPASGR
jgi:hypothetical protein